VLQPSSEPRKTSTIPAFAGRFDRPPDDFSRYSDLNLRAGSTAEPEVPWEQKFAAREKQKRVFVKALFEAGEMRLAYKVATCHTLFMARRCPSGHSWAYPVRCKVRGCPHCDRRTALKRKAEVTAYFRQMSQPRFMTLTLPGEFHTEVYEEGLDQLRLVWRRFRQRMGYKAHVDGAVYSIETTHTDKGWNWHFHVLFDGSYWPQADIQREWKAAGGGHQVRINAANKGSLRELLKYVTKGVGVFESPRLVGQFVNGSKRKKFFGVVGRFYGQQTAVKVELKADTPDPEACPSCGQQGIFLGSFAAGNVRWTDGIWTLKDAVFQ